MYLPCRSHPMSNSTPEVSTHLKSSVKARVSAKINLWKTRIARELSGGQTGGTSEGNSVRLYFDGDEAFESMLKAISQATHYVHLEMYMFASDAVGQKFATTLSDKAREGVPVRVLYDAIGSMEADKMQWADMRDAGVSVVEYRPVAFWRKRSGIIGRNHRKNLVIDGALAFTGGMNLTDVWSAQSQGDSAWRDTQCRVIGPAAHDLNQLFIDSWRYATEEKIFHRPAPLPLHEDEHIPHMDGYQSTQSGTQSRCVVVGSLGLRTSKEIRRLFSVNLARATHSIKMTMPYFVPPRRLRTALRKAKQRGIDIHILLPRDSDVKVVDWLREGLYPEMLRWGITLREYLGPILHAKTMTVDDQIAIVGSTNFDILSVVMNREVALVILDERIAAELNQQWSNDLALSERVTNQWEGIRPWWRLVLAKLGCLLIRRL